MGDHFLVTQHRRTMEEDRNLEAESGYTPITGEHAPGPEAGTTRPVRGNGPIAKDDEQNFGQHFEYDDSSSEIELIMCYNCHAVVDEEKRKSKAQGSWDYDAEEGRYGHFHRGKRYCSSTCLVAAKRGKAPRTESEEVRKFKDERTRRTAQDLLLYQARMNKDYEDAKEIRGMTAEVESRRESQKPLRLPAFDGRGSGVTAEAGADYIIELGADMMPNRQVEEAKKRILAQPWNKLNRQVRMALFHEWHVCFQAGIAKVEDAVSYTHLTLPTTPYV